MALLAWLFSQMEPPTNWQETYQEKSAHPYGLSVLYGLLPKLFEEREFIVLEDSLDDRLSEVKERASYLFIGKRLFMDTAAQRALIRFVQAGNVAFIAAQGIPEQLADSLQYDQCGGGYWPTYHSYYDSTVQLRLWHPELANIHMGVSFREGQYTSRHYWLYIDEEYFCVPERYLTPLGHFGDTLVNFARAPLGKGTVYLHTTPLVFTNIQLLEQEGQAYVEALLAHLPEGDIYWDRYSKKRNRLEGQRDYLNRALPDEGPLDYILRQPPLAWAWYLLIATGLLYLTFRAKRRQRIIPVLPSNTNTTLEFVGAIGQLYFLQNNHKKLAQQQLELFQHYIRTQYGLQGRNMEDPFIRQLAKRSDTDPELLRKIARFQNHMSTWPRLSAESLTDLHQYLEEFYQNSSQ